MNFLQEINHKFDSDFRLMVFLNGIVFAGYFSLLYLLSFSSLNLPFEIPLSGVLIFFGSYTGIAKFYLKDEELRQALTQSIILILAVIILLPGLLFLLDLIGFDDFSPSMNPLVDSANILFIFVLGTLIVSFVYTFAIGSFNSQKNDK